MYPRRVYVLGIEIQFDLNCYWKTFSMRMWRGVYRYHIPYYKFLYFSKQYGSRWPRNVPKIDTLRRTRWAYSSWYVRVVNLHVSLPNVQNEDSLSLHEINWSVPRERVTGWRLVSHSTLVVTRSHTSGLNPARLGLSRSTCTVLTITRVNKTTHILHHVHVTLQTLLSKNHEFRRTHYREATD